LELKDVYVSARFILITGSGHSMRAADHRHPHLLIANL